MTLVALRLAAIGDVKIARGADLATVPRRLGRAEACVNGGALIRGWFGVEVLYIHKTNNTCELTVNGLRLTVDGGPKTVNGKP
jgi:hypothetical protein